MNEKNFKDEKNFEKNVKKKTQIKKRLNGFSTSAAQAV